MMTSRFPIPVLNIRDGARTISDAAVRSANEYYAAEIVNFGIYVQENIGFKNKLFADLASVVTVTRPLVKISVSSIIQKPAYHGL